MTVAGGSLKPAGGSKGRVFCECTVPSAATTVMFMTQPAAPPSHPVRFSSVSKLVQLLVCACPVTRTPRSAQKKATCHIKQLCTSQTTPGNTTTIVYWTSQVVIFYVLCKVVPVLDV